MNRSAHSVFCTLAVVTLLAIPARAEWGYDGYTNGAASRIAPHPSGGVYSLNFAITSSAPLSFNLTAQWLDPEGVARFGTAGVLLGGSAFGSGIPQEMSCVRTADGSMWALVFHWDPVTGGYQGQLYGVDAGGGLLTPLGGHGIFTASYGGDTQLVADSAGDFYASWVATDGAGAFYVKAQRFNLAGVAQWVAGGRVTAQATQALALDAAAEPGVGLLQVWENTFDKIYGQVTNLAGTPQNGANGQIIEDLAGMKERSPKVIGDGSGGFRCAYAAGPFSSAWTCRLIDLDASLNVRPRVELDWETPNSTGIEVTSILSEADGATVAWTNNGLLKVNRFSPAGTSWSTVVVGNSAPVVGNGSMCRDGQGGIYIGWESTGDRLALIQRIDSSGHRAWAATGIQAGLYAPGLASDSGAVYAASSGNQGGTLIQGSIQRLEIQHGGWGNPEPHVVSANDVPQDQGGFVALNWVRSEHDQYPSSDLTHYSLWRATDAIPAKAKWVDLASYAEHKGEASLVRASDKAGYFWEYVTDRPALRQPGYSALTPTRSNSIPGNAAPHFFQVVAHTASPLVFWTGGEVGGESLDNLAPAAPASLSAIRSGANVLLQWPGVSAADLAQYRIYRSSAPGVSPTAGNLVGTATETTFTDLGASAAQALYYVVAAVDLHSNQGIASPEAQVSGATAVAGTPLALQMGRPTPNPFNPRTVIPLVVPVDGHEVSVEVYDVAGRRVRVLHRGYLAAGDRSLVWDGRDDSGVEVASGAFLIRLRAPGVEQVQRGVLLR